MIFKKISIGMLSGVCSFSILVSASSSNMNKILFLESAVPKTDTPAPITKDAMEKEKHGGVHQATSSFKTGDRVKKNTKDGVKYGKITGTGKMGGREMLQIQFDNDESRKLMPDVLEPVEFPELTSGGVSDGGSLGTPGAPSTNHPCKNGDADSAISPGTAFRNQRIDHKQITHQEQDKDLEPIEARFPHLDPSARQALVNLHNIHDNIEVDANEYGSNSRDIELSFSGSGLDPSIGLDKDFVDVQLRNHKENFQKIDHAIQAFNNVNSAADYGPEKKLVATPHSLIIVEQNKITEDLPWSALTNIFADRYLLCIDTSNSNSDMTFTEHRIIRIPVLGDPQLAEARCQELADSLNMICPLDRYANEIQFNPRHKLQWILNKYQIFSSFKTGQARADLTVSDKSFEYGKQTAISVRLQLQNRGLTRRMTEISWDSITRAKFCTRNPEWLFITYSTPQSSAPTKTSIFKFNEANKNYGFGRAKQEIVELIEQLSPNYKPMTKAEIERSAVARKLQINLDKALKIKYECEVAHDGWFTSKKVIEESSTCSFKTDLDGLQLIQHDTKGDEDDTKYLKWKQMSNLTLLKKGKGFRFRVGVQDHIFKNVCDEAKRDLTARIFPLMQRLIASSQAKVSGTHSKTIKVSVTEK